MFYRSHAPLVRRAEIPSRTSEGKMQKVRQAAHVVVAILFVVLALFVFNTAAYAQSIHRVRVGETLGSIAAQYGTSVSTLASQNGISNPNHIYVGQQLSIPGSRQRSSVPPQKAAPTYSTYVPVSSGSTTASIACPRSVRGGELVHYVRAGDTLSGIASRYGVGLSTLRSTNSLWTDRISVGKCIIIPSGIRATPAPDRRSSPQVVQAVVTPVPLTISTAQSSTNRSTYSTP